MYENPRTIWASDYWYDAEPECPYDDSMECDDAYELSKEEKAKLEAEAEEFRNENDLPF